MAWPTSKLPLHRGYQRADEQISSIKRIAQNNSATMAGGPVSAPYIFALAQNLIGAYRILDEASKLSGISEHISAEEQGGRTAAQVAQDFTAIKGALISAFNEIISKCPVDADGYLLIKKLNPDGSTTDRTFDPAYTAALRGLLDAIADPGLID